MTTQSLLHVAVLDPTTIRIALSEPHACQTCGRATQFGTVTRDPVTLRSRFECWNHSDERMNA